MPYSIGLVFVGVDGFEVDDEIEVAVDEEVAVVAVEVAVIGLFEYLVKSLGTGMFVKEMQQRLTIYIKMIEKKGLILHN
ncbi:MAG: hypothetical protein J6U22_09570 [Bacteroidaceae bacterium]|nr:hypothetical protein [Bacteroidaceae bacterium]